MNRRQQPKQQRSWVQATKDLITNLFSNNPWRVFYSDAQGNVQETSLGASGTVLMSNGASAAPSFQTIQSGGFANGGNLTSASSLTVASFTFYHVTGTTTVTALSTLTQGALVALHFDSANLTITHNATSMILIGGKDYVTLAGDTLYFVSLGSGNWEEHLRPFAFGGTPFDNTSAGTTGQVITKQSSGYAAWQARSATLGGIQLSQTIANPSCVLTST